jgi:hypothetical protein
MNFTKSLPKKKKIIQNNNMGKYYGDVRLPITSVNNPELHKETKPKTDIFELVKEKDNVIKPTNISLPITNFYNTQLYKEAKPKTDILQLVQEKNNNIEPTNISLPITNFYNTQLYKETDILQLVEEKNNNIKPTNISLPITNFYNAQLYKETKSKTDNILLKLVEEKNNNINMGEHYPKVHFQITNNYPEKNNKEIKLKTETNILKLLQQKTITIENVYQERYNNINATGLGDFIRGSYFLIEFGDNNNIPYNINILNHPISQFLEIYQNKNSLFINNINKFEEDNFHPHILSNNLITNIYDSSTNNTFIKYLYKQNTFNQKLYIYTITYPSAKISEKHKEYMKQILKPCKRLELIVDNTLLKLGVVKKQFIIIHIRYGDDFLIKQKNQIKQKHLEMIQNTLKLDLSKQYLLISDNIIMKNIILMKYPFIKTHFNEISHTGEGLQLETNKLQNTMIDFYMFSHASSIIAFSVYQHGTGFSKWSAETYSVPYTCYFLP